MRSGLLILFTVLFICSLAQDANYDKIPLLRRSFHEKIDASQQTIISLDGNGDDKFAPSPDDDLNQQLTLAATKNVDDLQNDIESNASLDNNNKIKFLRGLNEVLNSYISAYRFRSVKASSLIEIVNDYKEAMPLEMDHQSIENIIAKSQLETGQILMRSIAFNNNSGTDNIRNILFIKQCQRNPDKILQYLLKQPDVPFADSLISVVAHRNQDDIYTYAASNTTLSSKIRNSSDPLVKVITSMAGTKSGRQYFPFIDDVYKGKITLRQIDSVKDDPLKYYRLLVKTEVSYADRLRLHDTAMGMGTLAYRLKKAGEYFINEINGLHESPDNVRFKIIDPLNPQELYYLAVMQEEEIYTSSYVRGVYPRIFQKMKVSRGDSLLLNVRFDHFKKWIKMAANYNTLDHFLKSMDKDNAEILMKAFVNGLDRSHGKDSLEDAVDVAGSYASISNKELQQLILNQVQYDLQQAQQNNKERAISIYSILNTLFLSMDSTNHIDVAATLGIRPIYYMPVSDLKDTSGKIVIQQFFYGDKDGQTYFNTFLNSFRNANWRITQDKEWATVSSTKGLPLVIYSNKPLDEQKDLDAQAQQHLADYLFEHNLNPSVVIHRGHSYYVSETIKQLVPSAKVILLGSCGGYQSLSTVLGICPEAHIISSKQTGSGAVNQPLINGLVDNLRQGKNLDWPIMWQNFSKMFQHNELFDDYVPPYKNLGAVFLMAYKKLEDKQESLAQTTQ